MFRVLGLGFRGVRIEASKGVARGLSENRETSIWSLCYKFLQLSQSLIQMVATVDPVHTRGFLRSVSSFKPDPSGLK